MKLQRITKRQNSAFSGDNAVFFFVTVENIITLSLFPLCSTNNDALLNIDYYENTELPGNAETYISIYIGFILIHWAFEESAGVTGFAGNFYDISVALHEN